jgi:hypothetical protein
MEEKIEEIKNALRTVMQAIAKRGQALSPEVKELLAQVIRHAGERISQLRQEETISKEPTPPGADLLWILSGGNANAFSKYLSNVPDPLLNSIASNPARVQSLVNKLSQQVTLPAGEVQQGIPHADLNSSNIYGFSYDPRSNVLKVKFQGDGVYEYQGVPPGIFKIFKSGAIPARTSGQNQYGSWWIGKNPSLGASFYQLIRDQFPYRKVA